MAVETSKLSEEKQKLALEKRQLALEEQKLALEKWKSESDDAIRRAELEIKKREVGWIARLLSPLTATLFAGILTIAGSVFATRQQGVNTLELEREKFGASSQLETRKQQHELILKMISVGNEEQARANLRFLAQNELISDKALAKRLAELKTSPVLPPPGNTRASPRATARGLGGVIQSDEDVIDRIILWEGGFVDIPNDPGGPTNSGISQAVLSNYLGRKVTVEELKAVPRTTIYAIYKLKYLDHVAEGITDFRVRAALFNLAVWSGPSRATTSAQVALGRVLGRSWTADGKPTPDMIAQINALPDKELFIEHVNCAHLEFLKKLKVFEQFGKALTNRLREFSPEKSYGVCPELT